MALVRGKVNPLNVLDIRKLDYIPEHFETLVIQDALYINEINKWIYLNLNCRYAISKKLKLNESTNKVEVFQEIGIEDPRELIMFSLSCPYLNKKD